MSKVKNAAPLTDKERELFAKTIFEARRKDSNLSWSGAFFLGRNALPPNRISKNIDHPNKLPWIKPMFKELEQAAKPILGASKRILSDEQKMRFAQNVLEFQKVNPEATAKAAIRYANEQLPLDLQISPNTYSMAQLTWLPPLLEKLKNPPLSKKNWECKLTDEEKAKFADIVYSLRKGGATWTRAMREANAFMPQDHRIADTIVNPGGVPWLQRALAKLEEADTSRVVIDHRGTLPKAEEPIPTAQKQRKYAEVRVYLHPEEKLQFAEHVYSLRRTNPGWSWQMILEEANKEMPAHKQYPKMVSRPSQLPWLPKLLNEVAKRPPEPVAPVVEIPSAPSPVPASPAAPTLDMQAMMMEAFKEVAREQFAARGMSPSALVGNVVQAPKVEEPPKKKVLVVGLLDDVTRETQRDFGRHFNFKFMHANSSAQHIRDNAKNADISIIMTKFVSHSTCAVLRQFPGFTYCNGTASALKNVLEDKLWRMKEGQ